MPPKKAIDLTGLRILNTRPQGQSRHLSDLITKANGHAIELPALEIQDSTQNWLSQLPRLDTIETTIFTSANAVHFFFKKLAENQIIWPAHIKIIAIGQGTATALALWQNQQAAIPTHSNSEHLLTMPALTEVSGKHLLVVKGEYGRTLLHDTLQQRGAIITSVCVYRRILPTINPEFIEALWRNRQVDIILYTSQQALEHIFALFGQPAHAWLRNTPCIVISERLAKAAKERGITTVLVSDYDALLITLAHYRTTL